MCLTLRESMMSWLRMSEVLVSIGEYLLIIFGILFIVLGMFGSLMLIFIFLRSPFKENSSSIYLIINGILSMLILPLYFLPNLFTFGFKRNVLALNGDFCRFQMSFATFTVTYLFLIRSFLFIDRYCLSSRSARIRSLSSKKHSILFLSIGFLLSLICIGMPTAFLFDTIEEKSSGQIHCTSKSHLFLVFAALIYFPILQGLCPILLFLLFWYLTKKQIEQIQNERFLRRFEKQLSRMYLFQILCQMISSVPFATINLYRTLTSSTIRPVTTENFIQFIRLISILLFYFQYSTDFYIYYLTSNEIRQQTKKIFSFVFHRRISPLNLQSELGHDPSRPRLTPIQ